MFSRVCGGCVVVASVWLASAARAALPPVVLGGTQDMLDLLTPENTADFRAAGGGLYIQHDGWTRGNMAGNASARQTIWDLFKANGSAGAEIGGESIGGRLQAHKDYYNAYGVKVDFFSINGFLRSDLSPSSAMSYAKTFVDQFRSSSATANNPVPVLTPVATPNSNPSVVITNPFSSSAWDETREIAAYGGGWTIDSPPAYFFNKSGVIPGGNGATAAQVVAAYQQWIVDATQWTNDQGKKSIHILSPNSSGNNFFADSVQYVRFFSDKGVLPKQWIVQNYGTPGTPSAGYPNRIGSEDVNTNVAYVAKWLIGNVQGRDNSLDLYATRTTAGAATVTVGQNAFSRTSASPQNNPMTNLGAQTYTIKLKNLGTNATTDFYTPQLIAYTSGDAAKWQIKIMLGATDITSQVYGGGGYTLAGTNVLDAGELQTLSLTLTPLAGANSYFNFNLFVRANPIATIYADANSFTFVPEPASLGVMALAALPLLRRRR